MNLREALAGGPILWGVLWGISSELNYQERELNTNDAQDRDFDLHNVLRENLAYHLPKTGTNTALEHEAVRGAAMAMSKAIIEIVPRSRHRSLALSAIEEAMHWGNAAVALNGGIQLPTGEPGESPAESSFGSKAMDRLWERLEEDRPGYMQALLGAGQEVFIAGNLDTRYAGNLAQTSDAPTPLNKLDEAYRDVVRNHTPAEVREALKLLEASGYPQTAGRVEERLGAVKGHGVTAMATEPADPEVEIAGPEPRETDDISEAKPAAKASVPAPLIEAHATAMLTEDPNMAWRIVCPSCGMEHFMQAGYSTYDCPEYGSIVVIPPDDVR